MASTNSTLRLVLGISALLLVTFSATGFITRSYRREKLALGNRHYEMGQKLESNSQLNAAIEEYRKALVYCPDTAVYRGSFASALIQAGHLDEAQSHVDQLLGEDPTNGSLNLMVARLAAKQGKTSRAIDFYQRAVYEYWPPTQIAQRKEARLELIDLLAETGRRDQLIAELMTLYANFPSDLPLRMQVGFKLLDQGAAPEAIQVFREVERSSNRTPDAHRGMAEAYFASGEYVSARHEYEHALHLDAHDQASEQGLKLTNDVIDLDPALAGIRESERRRRAQNLLRRVVDDVGTCGSGSDQSMNDQAESAAKLLTGAEAPKAEASDLQRAATDLWANRIHICSGHPTSDITLATVMARIKNE